MPVGEMTLALYAVAYQFVAGRLLVTKALLALARVLFNWFIACLNLWPNRPIPSRDLFTIVIAVL